ncbi:MAG: hypothetical protein M3R17_20165, partial [Bacteroidota bacterium]|nr:hypothetical protein [Bacteroidota bacterium]
LVIGIVCDIKLIPAWGRINYPNQFRSDFSDACFVPSSEPDSLNAGLVCSAVEYGSLKGNNMFYGGLMLSLWPHKAGGIMLQVKRGLVGYEMRNVFGSVGTGIGGYDKYPFTISRNWKYELTFKPAAFFMNTHLIVYDSDIQDFLKTFSISLFYERVNFTTAEFNGTAFSSFLTAGFMSKYAIDHRFGFKIGLSLY